MGKAPDKPRSNPMSTDHTISVCVDPTNPGQFFACCGLLELADRLWPGAEGWFDADRFFIQSAGSLSELLDKLKQKPIANTMTAAQRARLDQLSSMTSKQRSAVAGADEEKTALEALHRELPVLIDGGIALHIDWFCDEFSGGSRFKTWAGRQSVLEIACAMHGGLNVSDQADELWRSARGIGLPFYFDADQGGQGSALDVGFSFDSLAGGETTRIEIACRPALELLAFIGLQRFRPREVGRTGRFIYVTWQERLPVSVAACAACGAVAVRGGSPFEFRLLYRNKYYKSFLPAIPFQGDQDE